MDTKCVRECGSNQDITDLDKLAENAKVNESFSCQIT